MHKKQRYKRPDMWIGTLLGTGLFVLIESLTEVGQAGWYHDFLSSAFYFNLVIMAAAGHYMVTGQLIRSFSKKLLVFFSVLPLSLLVSSAVLSPTEWFVGYGNWGLIFAGLCSQVLPGSLLVFLVLVLTQNFYHEGEQQKEISCYLLAAVVTLSFMVWLEGHFGTMSIIVFIQLFSVLMFVIGRQTGKIAALRYARNQTTSYQ